jgi:polyhydroxyalkanoate synthase
MTAMLADLIRAPRAAVDFANVLLTRDQAPLAQTPRDAIWTHRGATLYRYRSEQRRHPVPILLVFALINRPGVFDLRPGNSLVEFLLEEGFDVFLADWGTPGEEDADLGLEHYVCDMLPWSIRETLRAAGEHEVTLMGWCMGGTMCAMHAALEPSGPVRNLVLLTTPVTGANSTYRRWIVGGDLDVDRVAGALPLIPGEGVDWANKLLKPVTNHWTTYRKLWDDVLAGRIQKDTFNAMARWVADNPPFPARAFADWVGGIYRDDALLQGTLELRGRRVDLRNIEQNLLVITARQDHIAPPEDSEPLLDLVSSADVTHLDRPGGHIGLVAGSRARHELWPELGAWLAERSGR